MIIIVSSSLAESRRIAAGHGLHRATWRHLWNLEQLDFDPLVWLCECAPVTLPLWASMVVNDIIVEKVPCPVPYLSPDGIPRTLLTVSPGVS